VWTFKRFLLLAVGFGFFLSAYLGYGRSFIGGIDGLPALPDKYLRGDTNPPPPPPKPGSIVEARLQQAFGIGCRELGWAIRLELKPQNLVLAASSFQIEEDGRVCLTPVSVGLFGKNKGDGKEVEINTIRGKVAHLKFDRPVASLPEINGRKVVEAELTGDIEIVNNRRTQERTDDLSVTIKTGPLYYNESRHLIWTHDVVHLIDLQSKPDPIQIWGKGMELELLTEAPQPKPGAPASRKKTENISGVKRVTLQSDVVMYLYTDGHSGFPGGGGGHEGAKPADNGNQDKVTINTPGKFVYELGKETDVASFEIPPPDPRHPVKTPEHVTVERRPLKLDARDQLVCEHLELRLRRKDAGPAKPGGNPAKQERASVDRGLEIDWARATGKEVQLSSDAEQLDAHGNELIYDAKTRTTTLRGEPRMEAHKEGSDIFARELRLEERAPEPGAGGRAGTGRGLQHTIAQGPGHIDMMDGKSRKKNIHASWDTLLVSMREGDHDVLTLTGNAKFIDDEHEQTMEADVLKVWLEPQPQAGSAKRDPRAGDVPGAAKVTLWPGDLPDRVKPPAGLDEPPGSAKPGAAPAEVLLATTRAATWTKDSPRPQHVEATGNVSARSREMNVHDTNRLVVWFRDVVMVVRVLPAAGPDGPRQEMVPGQAPAPTPAHQAANPANLEVQPARPLPAEAAPAAPVPPSPAVPAGKPPQAEQSDQEPPRPIDLSARTVEAWVLRCEEKNTLEKLHTEGKVYVRQDPAPPHWKQWYRQPEGGGGKGLDIRGETLDLDYRLDGQPPPPGPLYPYLIVKGTDDLAQLLLDKIYIVAQEVHIDQAADKAWVPDSAGAMRLESDRSFSGEPLQKTVPLTIHWNESMLFNGNFAEFHGGVQADQEDGRLACQAMQVFFDRPVSLKEGQKSDRPAKVQNLVCDSNVRIEEAQVQGKEWVKYQKIEGTAFQMSALEPDPAFRRAGNENGEGNEVNTSGPGSVRLFDKGGVVDPNAPGAAARPAARPGQEKKPGEPQQEEGPKLTYIVFRNRMYANNRTNKAVFWGGVRVLNLPCTDPLVDLDLDTLPDHLPKDSMYLTCDQLTVLRTPVQKRLPDGKMGPGYEQEMTAEGRVVVQAPEFWGRANTVTFNEDKDQIIFDGGEDGLATLYKRDVPGAKMQEVRGKKITLIRKTGFFKIDQGQWIGGQ
jgi:lipopolysaccharide export system protein LptA